MKALFGFPGLFILFTSSTAAAELPMGLKCEPSIKIAAAEVGAVGKYSVQMGMKKEEHTALLNRKKVKPVDGCHFPGLTPGQTVVARYSGPDSLETEVQCIDLNTNEPVEFPKSIYTVRDSDIPLWQLMPYCPDGKSMDDFPCSKLNTQSERGSYYRDTVLQGNHKDAKKRLHNVDMVFDPPYRNSVPSNAKLFCALINRDGKVVIAGTAQYPAAEEAEPAERRRTRDARPSTDAEGD